MKQSVIPSQAGWRVGTEGHRAAGGERERERESERERERERERVCVREKERDRVCVREIERAYVCVRERVCSTPSTNKSRPCSRVHRLVSREVRAKV